MTRLCHFFRLLKEVSVAVSFCSETICTPIEPNNPHPEPSSVPQAWQMWYSLLGTKPTDTTDDILITTKLTLTNTNTAGLSQA